MSTLTQEQLPATWKQRRSLFWMTKDKGWWDKEMSMGEAGALIDRLRREKVDYQRMWTEAWQEGVKAVADYKPIPMVVQQYQGMLDDPSPVAKQWVVEGGCCGFAWVLIKPGSCSLARWLQQQGLGHKYYYGGWAVWVDEYGQSMGRKEVHASAVARWLRERGIDASMGSRMD